MKKILTVLLLTLSLFFVFPSAAFAAELELVEDVAGILTPSEQHGLLGRAETISKKYKCDVAIIIIEEMTDDDGAYEWARYIYDKYDFGYGADKSGVLLFLSMDKRDYALIAYGYGNTAFTDYGKDVMLDKHILPLLKENKYHEAFSAYLDKAEEFLQTARDGAPFDRGSDPGSATIAFFIKLAVTVLLPILIALIVCTMWKKQMKTAVTARAAANYIPAGGFNLTGQTDMFLYRTQTRTSVQTSSSSGGTTKDSRGYSGRSGKF